MKENIDGATALMICARRKNGEKVKLLLEYNADKSIKDKKGRTALDYVDLPYSEGLDSKKDSKIAKQELKELLK